MNNKAIDWIGNIPNNWSVKKLKYVLNERNTMNKDGKETFILSLTIEDGVIPYTEKKSGGNKAKEDLTKYKIAKAGDIVINSMNVVVGAVGLSEYDGVISPVYYSFYSKDGISVNKYYYYLFLCSTFEDHLFGLGNGIMVKISDESGKMNTIRKKIPIEKLKNEYIPVPPIHTQKKIAEFLDERCEQIDNIVKLNNKEIDLLNEYKTSLFSKITDDYSKKYNGENWKSAPMRRITEFITCGIASTPEYAEDNNGLLFLSAQNVKNQKLDLSKRNYITDDFKKRLSTKTVPKKGDILQVRVGATIGNTAIVDIDEEFGVYVSLTHIRVNNLVNNRYLRQYMETPKFLSDALSTVDFAGSQGNLNVNILKGIHVLLPPIDIQEKIANAVELEINKINNVIEYRQKINESILNYKKSLIYEIVTGKKEV